MVRQSVKQATCEWCDEEDAEFSVTDKDIVSGKDVETEIKYDVRCSGCKFTGTISISESGPSATAGINHDDASWNQEEDEESDSDE